MNLNINNQNPDVIQVLLFLIAYIFSKFWERAGETSALPPEIELSSSTGDLPHPPVIGLPPPLQ